MILPILLAHVPLIGKLIYDYRLFLRRKAVNHGMEWIVVAILEIPVAYLFAAHNSIGISFMLLVSMGLAGAMIAFYLWIMFDGIYNKLRNQDWWFIGSPDTDSGWYSKDSWTERLFRKTGLVGQIVIKVCGFILFTVLFILL
jgi:hypothetical protein